MYSYTICSHVLQFYKHSQDVICEMSIDMKTGLAADSRGSHQHIPVQSNYQRAALDTWTCTTPAWQAGRGWCWVGEWLTKSWNSVPAGW